MTTLLKASVALVLGVSLDAGLNSIFAEDGQTPSHRPAHHHVVDFDKAKALVSSPVALSKPPDHVPETDGLSRDSEDCNYGCVDH